MVNAGEREPGYAWVVLAVLFLALGVASGTQGSFGLLVKPWEAEFGWDRGAISLTASIGFVVYGLTQALAGRWADRIGPRAIFAAGLVILGVGTLAISSIGALRQERLGVLFTLSMWVCCVTVAAAGPCSASWV